jgi:hypothetical protein
LRRKEEKHERREQKREKKGSKRESKRARHELRRQEKTQRRHRPSAAAPVSGAGTSVYPDSAGYSGIDVSFEARLRDEMFAEGEEGGFGWAEDMEETAGQVSEDWFTSVAGEVEGLRRQRAHDRDRAAAERAQEEHTRRAARAAEQRQWQQAMLEEEAADAARREEVKRKRAAAAHVAAHLAYEAGWLALAKHEGGISVQDVPWPCEHPTEGSSGDAHFVERVGRVVLRGGGSGMDVLTRRKALQAEQRRWHPDKFTARWGGRLRESTRAAVLERVTQVSQALNALISDESILGGDRTEMGPRPTSRSAAGQC